MAVENRYAEREGQHGMIDGDFVALIRGVGNVRVEPTEAATEQVHTPGSEQQA